MASNRASSLSFSSTSEQDARSKQEAVATLQAKVIALTKQIGVLKNFDRVSSNDLYDVSDDDMRLVARAQEDSGVHEMTGVDSYGEAMRD